MAAPDADPHRRVRAENAPDDEPFFDTLLDEALRPLTVTVGELEVTFEVPDGGQVGDLDDAETDAEVLEALLVPIDDDLGADERDEARFDDLLDALEHRPAREQRALVDTVLQHFALALAPPAGWRHLVDLLDRFGPGLEWDLLTGAGGLRLHDFLRDPDRHPWALLYRTVDFLPQGGGYWAAVQADEQWAADQLDAEARGHRAKRSSRPALFGWTAQAERETAILDALRQGVHATWGASPKFKGKGGRPPQPLPRPRNAMAAARRARLHAEHDEIVGMLLPRGVEPPPEPPHPAPGERPLPSACARGGVLLDP